jgi:hypothetical protein
MPATQPRSAVRGSAIETGGDAAELLAHLGFTLLHSQHPGAGGSHLLVAFRRTPTLTHFDPEAVTYYAQGEGHAVLATVDRTSALVPASRRVLWGHVHVVDRLRVENRFLTFGGTMTATSVGPDLTVLDLRSPGPIARWGGHSQGVDSLAGSMGAFFGRLILPVDFTPGAEARLNATPPDVLYAAFLLDLDRRLGPDPSADGELGAWLRFERARLVDESSWAAARRLIADFGL